MTNPTLPILRDFPDQLETERLIIRVPRPGDGAMANAAIRESLDELRPWMPWAQPAPTVEETEEVFRRAAAQWITHENLMLIVWRKENGLFVDGNGVHNLDWSVPSGEIGYWVRTSLRGQGYITETVLGLTQFAFQHLSLQRLEIRCDARNTRSTAVAERAGFTFEARFRNHTRGVDDTLRDTLIYAHFPKS